MTTYIVKCAATGYRIYKDRVEYINIIHFLRLFRLTTDLYVVINTYLITFLVNLSNLSQQMVKKYLEISCEKLATEK